MKQRAQTPRTLIAIGILALWLGGLGWLGMRELNKPFSARLVEGAQVLAPVTYYYIAELNGKQIGQGYSSIDTVGPRINTVEFLTTETKYGIDRPVRLNASLTRGFALQSFNLQVGGIHPMKSAWKVRDKSTALLETQLPIAFMLTGEHKIGRSESLHAIGLFDQKLYDIKLRIQAESLFTIADSSMYDSTTKHWVPAHSDTIRAWNIVMDDTKMDKWVDAQGRVVKTITDGVHLTRTAYEIAFRNKKPK